MNDDLAAWLLEQIAEDEAVAKAAATARSGSNYRNVKVIGPNWTADAGMVVGTDNLWDNEGASSLCMDDVAAVHIARHDPARVLADCETKRRIVENYRRRAELLADPGQAPMRGLYENDRSLLDFVLRYLTLPYADRPGYRQEWAPPR